MISPNCKMLFSTFFSTFFFTFFLMSLYADCQKLIENFEGCDEDIVERIKVALLDRLCDPNNHYCTIVRLPRLTQLNETSILVRPIFNRGANKAVITVVVDSDNVIYTFPYSESDADMIGE